MTPYYAEDDAVTLYHGDCLDVLRSLPDASVAAVVTDPPYGLEFMGKEWDRLGVAPIDKRLISDPAAVMGTQDSTNGGNAFSRSRIRFGQGEGTGAAQQAWHEQWCREAFRVLKPGGHMLAFGGTRTFHRLACAVEDAGFEVRDSIAWLYGSGFPKSLDVSKAIDKAARGVPQGGVDPTSPNHGKYRTTTTEGKRWDGDSGQGYGAGGSRFLADGMASGSGTEHAASGVAAIASEAESWQGWGTALKPAHEPIVVARKPLAGTVAGNVLAHGTGALNIDGCRVDGGTRPLIERAEHETNRTTWNSSQDGSLVGGSRNAGTTSRGRWPANVVLDESHEPVLRLRYNLPTEVERTIRESFGARTDHLPAVQDAGIGAAEQGCAPEVLLSRVPRGVDVGEPDRREGAEVGQAAHAGDASADLGNEASQTAEGREGVELEGWALRESGLRLREVGQPAADRATAVRPDGNEDARDVHRGASASDSATPGSPAPAVRGCASHQRREVGQPAGEPRAPRLEQLAPDETRRGRRGDVQASPGERGASVPPLEVLRRECPPGWWHYFEVVGYRREGQAVALDEQSGELTSGKMQPTHTTAAREVFGQNAEGGYTTMETYGDSGGASRFFYVAKADASERVRVNGTAHPTVKPLALMRWLVRLVTPPGGVVLEPFAGSGTTVEACLLEGFRCIAVEREADYLPLIVQRINRRRDPVAAVKASGDDGGLFDLFGEGA